MSAAHVITIAERRH